MKKRASEARRKCIYHTAVSFAGMIRTFEKETNKTLIKALPSYLEKIYKVNTKQEFNKIHSRFCEWGIRNIKQRETSKTNASYGQVAKTFNVMLKVIIYYGQLPGIKKSNQISKFLHAAVDNSMMKKLYKKCDVSKPPASLSNVDQNKYIEIQKLVGEFIAKKHNNKIPPVQFDDIYWLKWTKNIDVLKGA